MEESQTWREHNDKMQLLAAGWKRPLLQCECHTFYMSQSAIFVANVKRAMSNSVATAQTEW